MKLRSRARDGCDDGVWSRPDPTDSGGTAAGVGAEDENGLFWIGDNEKAGDAVRDKPD